MYSLEFRKASETKVFSINKRQTEDSGMEESVMRRLHRVQLGGIDPVLEMSRHGEAPTYI